MSETVLTRSEPLFRGSAEPFCGFDIVGRSGVAEIEERTEILLCHRVSMLGRELIPVKRKRRILGDTISASIQTAKIGFRRSIALQSCAAIIFGSFAEIAGEALAVFIEIAQKELGIRILLGSARLKPGERLIVAWRGRVSRDNELSQLMSSGRIAGIGERLKSGDGVNGDGLLLLARGRETETRGQQGAKNTEKESENAIDETSRYSHFDPLMRVPHPCSAVPVSSHYQGREIRRMRAHPKYRRPRGETNAQ